MTRIRQYFYVGKISGPASAASQASFSLFWYNSWAGWNFRPSIPWALMDLLYKLLLTVLSTGVVIADRVKPK